MDQRTRPPELDMTLDGQFLPSPRARPRLIRLSPATMLVAAIGLGLLTLAALLWLALMLLPVLVLGSLAGWAALRLRAWRRDRGALR